MVVVLFFIAQRMISGLSFYLPSFLTLKALNQRGTILHILYLITRQTKLPHKPPKKGSKSIKKPKPKMPPLKVEYAKSSRSRCVLKECNKFILKGELRIGTGVLMPGMEDPSFKWRHLCCFTDRQLKNVKSVDHIDGFDDLKEADQKHVLAMLRGELVGKTTFVGHGAEPGSSAAAASTAESGESKPTKKKRTHSPSSAVVLDPKALVCPSTHSSSSSTKPHHTLSNPSPSFQVDLGYVFPHHHTTRGGRMTAQHHCTTKKVARTEGEHDTDDDDDDGVSSNSTEDYEWVDSAQQCAASLPAQASRGPSDGPRMLLTAGSSDGTVAPHQLSKKVCPYGASCFRKNPEHFKEYDHPMMNMSNNVTATAAGPVGTYASSTSSHTSSPTAATTTTSTSTTIQQSPFIPRPPANKNDIAPQQKTLKDCGFKFTSPTTMTGAPQSSTPLPAPAGDTVKSAVDAAGYAAFSTGSTSATASGGGCPFGELCFRTDPMHRKAYHS